MQKDRVIAVEYTGDGAWFQGIPARALTLAEVESFGQSVEGLEASGFYTVPLTPDELEAKKTAEAAALANANAKTDANNNQGGNADSTKK